MKKLDAMKKAVAANKKAKGGRLPQPRKCCASQPGQDPHAAGCVHHPDTPKKKKTSKLKSPSQHDAWEETKGRWPAGTGMTLEWEHDVWHLIVDVPGETASRHSTGSGLHKLLSKAFRDYLASINPEVPNASPV